MVVEHSFDNGPRVSGLAERLAAMKGFDIPGRRLAELSARQQGPLADLARGQPLGHPLHPALTDLPIGFWTSSLFLDFVGGRRFATASRALVGVGVISAIPTVVAGIADLPALSTRKRRVAIVHATSNSVATLLYVKSWAMRRRHRLLGVGLGVAGATAATFGGYLGGWLAFGDEKPRERSTARSQVA